MYSRQIHLVLVWARESGEKPFPGEQLEHLNSQPLTAWSKLLGHPSFFFSSSSPLLISILLTPPPYPSSSPLLFSLLVLPLLSLLLLLPPPHPVVPLRLSRTLSRRQLTRSPHGSGYTGSWTRVAESRGTMTSNCSVHVGWVWSPSQPNDQ